MANPDFDANLFYINITSPPPLEMRYTILLRPRVNCSKLVEFEANPICFATARFFCLFFLFVFSVCCQVFFMYFTLFHVYFFSFPFGFSYLALVTTVLFLQHSMLFFWNTYEASLLLTLPPSFPTVPFFLIHGGLWKSSPNLGASRSKAFRVCS